MVTHHVLVSTPHNKETSAELMEALKKDFPHHTFVVDEHNAIWATTGLTIDLAFFIRGYATALMIMRMQKNV